jgi:Type I phosphodiesterase / nucleotide pyrophosphatase
VSGQTRTLLAPRIPTLLGLYCDELDAIGHQQGAENPRLGPALAELDRQLEATRAAGIFDRTAFVLTGDHGMETFTRAFGRDVLAALTEAGFTPQLVGANGQPAPETDVVMTVNGAASFYLRGEADSFWGRLRLRAALRRVPQIERTMASSS